jgi:CPA1 family monovalent cation:H+ antiporter
MLSTPAALFFLALLPLGVALEPWAVRRGIPRGALFVTLGFLGSEIAVRTGIDTGVRWDNFNTLISTLLLPVLTFAAALKLGRRDLLRELWPIAVLVLPVMVGTVAIAALFLYAVIGHADAFPLAVALLAAAILAATDSSAAVGVLRATGGSERLITLLEGESLFNDASAVVIFVLLLGFTMPGMEFPGSATAILLFLEVFLGGIAVGIACGVVSLGVMRIVRGEHEVPVLTIACVYGAFLVAQNLLHVSGVMSVLAAGLLLGETLAGNSPQHDFTRRFWEQCSSLASALILLLAGVTVTWNLFADQWLAMLIGIAALLLARTATVYGIFVPLTLRTGRAPGERAMLIWGAAPGTFAMALALSLPITLDSWYTIQAVVYGAVLFGLSVQGATLPWMAKKSG